MYTGMSLDSSLTGSLVSVGSVDSAAVCFTVVCSTGSYFSGFISWSGREPTLN